MSFGLKNISTTYQRIVTTMFHDMIHNEVEGYIYDMIVKLKIRKDIQPHLKGFYKGLRSIV